MVEKNKDRTCSTCEHIDIEIYKEPCLSCRCINGGIFTNYIPKKRIKRYPAASTINVSYVDYCDNDISSTRNIRRLCRLLYFPKIKHVIFNGPATIVFWQDDTKTVVKCREGDTFDPEKGIAMAIAKKVLGNKDGYYEGVKKWLPKKNGEETFIKTCDNCKHDNYHFLEPCNICFTAACNGRDIRTMWEPKEEMHTCSNCAYRDLDSRVDPCHACIFGSIQWRPRKTLSNEKTCETCKYHNRIDDYRYGLACSLCRSKEYWEPKE